ncbi:hypothetical protein [Mucilaginibacter antarcticus]|uniref:Uncharacterized protein n=1 Tax=Mucilaginibacter antarcticus TaxID=1855725 RepID=A0ABW5XNJ2_9SPHI
MHITTLFKRLAICCCLFMAAVLPASLKKTTKQIAPHYTKTFGLTATQSSILAQIGRLLNLPCSIAAVHAPLAVTKSLPGNNPFEYA